MKENSKKNNLVLVVDDDENIRDLLVFVLKRDGYSTETAASCDTAVKKINTLKPCLIILDLSLKNSSGLDVLEKMDDKTIPVIIMTGYSQDDIQESNKLISCECIKVFLTKPVLPKDISEIVKKTLS